MTDFFVTHDHFYGTKAPQREDGTNSRRDHCFKYPGSFCQTVIPATCNGQIHVVLYTLTVCKLRIKQGSKVVNSKLLSILERDVALERN
jgi:hypothetical protein